MATFVDTSSEEEQLTQLALYVTNLRHKRNPASAEQEDQFQKFIQENRPLEVLSRLINEHETIFSDPNERDVEGCVNVIAYQIRKLEPATAAKYAQRLRDAITSVTNDKPLLRLKMLTSIFYTLDSNDENSNAWKYDTFMAIAKYAADSNNGELIVPKLKELDRWLAEWKASQDQIRRTYKIVRQILLSTTPPRPLAAHKIQVKYLTTLSKEEANNPATSSEYEAEAVSLAKDAIKLDEIHQLDHLLQLESVKLLEKHATHSVLYDLLRIFASEKYEQYQQFISKHPGYLESIGLREEDSRRKMRLLSLASLGAESEEVPYNLIAQTLHISEDEVETWIISAISAKMIDAKINQLRRVVIISYCVQRVFTQQQWKQLGTKLDAWKTNIKQLLAVVQNTKAQGPAAIEKGLRSQPAH
eukprot:TRINITY_DN2786_c0_g1_i1.p1 TRINITY_DN2786_c0_g1~~TRINITY_DN2786_c0_g1_i1.p1  ORF type:complete len:423 (-),score=106.42 TRINITY_DN2786_c0_g1_i1:67-1314(-)